MLRFAVFTPHPPIIVPGIGQPEDLQQVADTIRSMQQLGTDMRKIEPHTVVVISPHAHAQYNRFVVNSDSPLEGGFRSFGLEEQFRFRADTELVAKIKSRIGHSDIPLVLEPGPLDHGVLVPLHYLVGKMNLRVVHLAFTAFDFQTQFRYGQILGRILEEEPRKIAIIASGDLSHRLTPDAPAGYSARGAEFDRKIVEILEQGRYAEILTMDPDLIEEAGECGLRSLVILLGMLSEREFEFRKLSYEGPFGVGYLTARFI